MKIATDACADASASQEVPEKTQQNKFCRDVIANPRRLENLDLK